MRMTRSTAASTVGHLSSLCLRLHCQPSELTLSPPLACRARSASASTVGHSSFQSSGATVVGGGNNERELGDGNSTGEIGDGDGDGAVEIGVRTANSQRTPVDLASEREGGRGIKNIVPPLQAPSSPSTPSLTGGGDKEGPRTATVGDKASGLKQRGARMAVGRDGGRTNDALCLHLHCRSPELAARDHPSSLRRCHRPPELDPPPPPLPATRAHSASAATRLSEFHLRYRPSERASERAREREQGDLDGFG
uniref:Uncharacterized protein n=2 Tax=Oryza sativa subsp. japonica TaxID=39947 RepID=Q2R739_ORYSJ|nr:hypothetical protein LOC_Os11g17910 [Oryza sativa Japonica Group]ABA92695.1 expressed protein [Oryza sativa Japonica Group]